MFRSAKLEKKKRAALLMIRWCWQFPVVLLVPCHQPNSPSLRQVWFNVGQVQKNVSDMIDHMLPGEAGGCLLCKLFLCFC